MEGVGDSTSGRLTLVEARPATRQKLALVHSVEYLDDLRRFAPAAARPRRAYLRRSRLVVGGHPGAGAGLAAVEALRPDAGRWPLSPPVLPGTMPWPIGRWASGLVNNVAVAAASSRGSERVLVVDWDVHHETDQALSWDEPAVLYVSTHQCRATPDRDGPSEVEDPRRGIDTQRAAPSGATVTWCGRPSTGWWRPVVDRFRPTWVLVSAGSTPTGRTPCGRPGPDERRLRPVGHGGSGYAPSPGRHGPVPRGWIRPRLPADSVSASSAHCWSRAFRRTAVVGRAGPGGLDSVRSRGPSSTAGA